jgi:hypothetical protein
MDSEQNEVILAMAERLAELSSTVAESRDEVNKVWVALSGIAGLDGLAIGVAQIAEVLGPLKLLVPPVVHRELAPGVAQAISGIRQALGLVVVTNGKVVPVERPIIDRLPTQAWDNPVAFIGQP